MIFYNEYLESPIGLLAIQTTDFGLRSLQFTKERSEESPNIHSSLAKDQLAEYLKGERQTFDLEIDWSGYSTFYQKVWSALIEIPYGTTCSYLQLSHAIENPKAIRAVGGANGKNPICIVVPCHRVIGSDGSLTGYSQGLHIKEWLLNLENPKVYAPQGSLF